MTLLQRIQQQALTAIFLFFAIAAAGNTVAKCGEETPKGIIKFPEVTIDRIKKEVRIEAVSTHGRKILEFFLISSNERDYESAFVTKARPEHIHVGMMMIGLRPGGLEYYEKPEEEKKEAPQAPAPDAEKVEKEKQEPKAPMVDVMIEWKEDGKTCSARAESFLFDRTAKKRPEPTPWAFNGSFIATREGKKILAASMSDVIIAIFYDHSAIVNLPYATSNPYDDDAFGFYMKGDILPPHFADTYKVQDGNTFTKVFGPVSRKATIVIRKSEMPAPTPIDPKANAPQTE